MLIKFNRCYLFKYYLLNKCTHIYMVPECCTVATPASSGGGTIRGGLFC